MEDQSIIYVHETIVLNKHYPILDNNTFEEIVPGIYIIQDTSTDRCYVGASKNVGFRWRSHRSMMMNWGPMCEMYVDFQKKPDDWVFVLIEKCGVDQLAAREVFWVEEHQSLSPEWGYNLRPPRYPTRQAEYERIRVPSA